MASDIACLSLLQAAIEEQERESAALDALEAQTAALSCGDGCELASAAAGHGEVPGDDDIELVLDWSEAGHAQGLTGPTEWLDEAHQSVGLPASVDGQADASILADPSVAAGEAGESAVSAQEVVSVQA